MVDNRRYGGEVNGGGIAGEVDCDCCEGVVDGNGCSGGETDGGCFSDKIDCGSCGGKVNIGDNEFNRSRRGGTDGSGCETEADDEECRGDIEGGYIKDEADGGGCGGEIDCSGVFDVE